MSSTTLKLPFKRFVAQVSTGSPRPKSSYLALMAENLDALQACPWREAADVPASLTGHDFTAATQFSDAYDAFKLTGNYDSAAMTEVAYAGMAAYRFTIPASAVSGSVPVTSLVLPIFRDRFEKSGVHLSVSLSSSPTPSSDWSVVRGSGDLSVSAAFAQTSTTYLRASIPANGSVVIDLSGVSSGNPPAYIFVYVSLEDYTDHWAMYNSSEKRLYAIEGSAMMSGGDAEIVFADSVTPDSESVQAIAPYRFSYLHHYKGLDGYIYARVTSDGAQVTTENKDPVVPAYIYRDECESDGSGVTPYLQGPINALYSLLERGLVYTRSGEGSEMGASFSLGSIKSGGVYIWHWDILARAHIIPMKLPSFPVSRVEVTWSPYYKSGENVNEDSSLSDIPEFRDGAAQNGFINIWIQDGIYLDSFSETLLKNPRIYDARLSNTDGWRLIGQIDYETSQAQKSYAIDLSEPLHGPCATILITAYIPPDLLTIHNIPETRTGICPISITSLTDDDPAQFNLDSTDEKKAFCPGIILKG